ncbi:MAG: hypothetical protein IT435_07015 [Phycisphaerales bacterium]|nr:hypothetical protein [Phycisphaerales bacterium]
MSQDSPNSQGTTPPSNRPSLWKSKSLRLALGMTLVGLVIWIYSVVTRPPVSEVSAGTHHAASSLTPGAQSGASDKPATRVVDEAAPAIFRLGSSFVAGFFLGWLSRKFLKLAILVAGAVALGAYGLHKAGVVSIDPDAVKSTADQGLGAVRSGLESFKDFVFGYVPSAASGIAGMFMGIRRS